MGTGLTSDRSLDATLGVCASSRIRIGGKTWARAGGLIAGVVSPDLIGPASGLKALARSVSLVGGVVSPPDRPDPRLRSSSERTGLV